MSTHKANNGPFFRTALLVIMQGGAYGASCSFDGFSGVFGCSSYRDPNTTSTLAVFDGTSEYLKTAHISQVINGLGGGKAVAQRWMDGELTSCANARLCRMMSLRLSLASWVPGMHQCRQLKRGTRIRCCTCVCFLWLQLF